MALPAFPASPWNPNGSLSSTTHRVSPSNADENAADATGDLVDDAFGDRAGESTARDAVSAEDAALRPAWWDDLEDAEADPLSFVTAGVVGGEACRWSANLRSNSAKSRGSHCTWATRSDQLASGDTASARDET
jgi:hypothetical protein